MALKLVSVLGMVVLLFCAWGCSLDRKTIPWRAVLWGLALQFGFAILILKTAAGQAVFIGAQRGVTKLNEFAMQGAAMVFGPLANPSMLVEKWGPGNAFILAINISATIIVVSALSSLFYHWGFCSGWCVSWRLSCSEVCTSGSEILAAAANIFMGQTEAPLVIRPYLSGMTRSELLALMTSGMATIAGGVLAVYVSLGASSGHLLTASVMSAPAALLVVSSCCRRRKRARQPTMCPFALSGRRRTASTRSVAARLMV